MLDRTCPAQMLAPHDAEDLDIQDVRSGVIVIGEQPGG
jgi:hypothetical protein